ncbi:hypothetical protein L226DRAFT_47383 [Lentinus tigrinus ALCF2SS1-7]|uniref:uncharacterized protein n=1 Tax=Lentinus tigrinus ALCF2SS1-7 TaxID=1328758 RepID=UPI0011663CE7|nr:hypothetical protein L226DRAFT_47383 [Lentinus tigrinus ALCF2SS1-7]
MGVILIPNGVLCILGPSSSLLHLSNTAFRRVWLASCFRRRYSSCPPLARFIAVSMHARQGEKELVYRYSLRGRLWALQGSLLGSDAREPRHIGVVSDCG